VACTAGWCASWSLYDAIVETGAPERRSCRWTSRKRARLRRCGRQDQQAGRLDAIVHCAGTLRRRADRLHAGGLDVDAAREPGGMAALTRAAAPAPPGARVGSYSRWTRVATLPKTYWGSYAAAKAGLEALVHVLADEWENSPNLAAMGVIQARSPARCAAGPIRERLPAPHRRSLVPLYRRCSADGEQYRGGSSMLRRGYRRAPERNPLQRNPEPAKSSAASMSRTTIAWRVA
jgi:NAD(P)-dependent dehydrogenase (short-subunit alcohol dehydrogenase family)